MKHIQYRSSIGILFALASSDVNGNIAFVSAGYMKGSMIKRDSPGSKGHRAIRFEQIDV